jgi:hypothetical protein
MQPRNASVLPEFLFLVIPVVLFVVLLMLVVRSLDYDSLILEWVVAIALTIASVLLLAVLIARKVIMLREFAHQSKIRRAGREFDLEVHMKKFIRPARTVRSHKRRMYY